MIENLIPKDNRPELTNSYKLRSGFWGISVGAHILWIFIATQIHLTPKPRRPIYDEFIRPLERRGLVYRPPVKKMAATAEKRVGTAENPQGAKKEFRVIVATAPQAKSQKQIIIRNLPEAQVDLPAPDLVAKVETAMPPPPPKVQAKQFTAPAISRQKVLRETEVAASALPTPAVTASLNSPQPTGAAPLPKFAARQFVPPPPSARQPKLALPTEVSETLPNAQVIAASAGILPSAAPNLLLPAPKVRPKQFTAPAASSGGQTQTARATDVTVTMATAPSVSSVQAGPSLPSLTTSQLPGPPKALPPAPEASRGNAQANIAIASVNPNPTAAVPAASRSGQLSVAPVLGETSSGAVNPGALIVPNLTVRDPAPPKPDPAKSNTVIYAERVRSAATGAFAVALRPSNRSIPRAVDARFPGRNVYTVLIPIENLPAYGGDWILWFAEVAPLVGQTPSMKAPVPSRKIELIEKSREPSDTRLQITATLGSDGKLSNVKVLSNASAAVQEIVLEDIGSWEWKPATRNGVPIAIEGVFEIPFRLPRRP